MIKAAKALRDSGELPPTVDDPGLYRVRGFSAMLPKDMDWVSASTEWRQAFSAGPPLEYRAQLTGGRLATPPEVGTVSSE